VTVTPEELETLAAAVTEQLQTTAKDPSFDDFGNYEFAGVP
jgi:hypothetical protein